jgi:hypothetical protein
MDATEELTLAGGLSLRELIHDYRHQTLVLFKCCLLQPKVISSDAGLSQTADPSQMLFFGSRCEKLCMMQFALISLIPGLLRKLEDCADREFDSYEKKLMKPTSLRTSDRRSCMSCATRCDFFGADQSSSAFLHGSPTATVCVYTPLLGNAH